MNSIISNENLGTTKYWKFLRNDLISIVAADDHRFMGEYNDKEIEELFDEMAKDYLDDWTVSGFCIDEEDYVTDVLELVMALSSASILNRHPFRWFSESHLRPHDDSYVRDHLSKLLRLYTDLRPESICKDVVYESIYTVVSSNLNNDDFKHAPPTIFMIDTSNAGENYTDDFVKTLDTYFTIMGYGHMDIVYENRLVYINKSKYAAKVKNADDIKDGISDKYVVKFDPYSFSLFTDSIDLSKRMIYGVLLNELEIARCSNTPTPWKLIYTGNKRYDDEIFSFISSMRDKFKLEITESNNASVTYTYKFE